MESINVKRAKLLTTLERNLELHKKIFKETLVAFKKKYTARLEEMGKNAKQGKFELTTNLDLPHSYAQDYEDAIAMVTKDCREVIIISEEEFRRYVLNKWNWIHSFRVSYMSNTGYSGLMGPSGVAGHEGLNGPSMEAQTYFNESGCL